MGFVVVVVCFLCSEPDRYIEPKMVALIAAAAAAALCSSIGVYLGLCCAGPCVLFMI